MSFYKFVLWGGLFLLLIVSCRKKDVGILTLEEKLGKAIFFDATLSRPSGMSCATCHRPERGFADRRGCKGVIHSPPFHDNRIFGFCTTSGI